MHRGFTSSAIKAGIFTSASQGSCGDDFCQCGEPVNATCLDGVGALCACLQGTEAECTDDIFFDMYIDCHQGSFPEAECFADFIVEGTVLCGDAAEACF